MRLGRRTAQVSPRVKRWVGDAPTGRRIDDAGMSTYRITVQGELSPPFAAYFEGLTLESGHGETQLVGDIVDQAQLQGLLSRLGDLGLVLLQVSSVPAVEPPDPRPGDGGHTAATDHAITQGGRT